MVMAYSVAIDGPAGAGKSTIAKLISREMGYIYVDTGAMYRAMAVYFSKNKVNPEDESAINEAVKNVDIKIEYQNGEQQVILNGENVTGLLRTEETGNMASKTSKYKEVRSKLVELQRELAKTTDVVMDGRDIGTTVLPDAFVKIYLTASSDEDMMNLWLRVSSVTYQL
jgi:cytidylate kinase